MESSIHFERSITIALLPVVNTNKDSVTAKKKTNQQKWNLKCWVCSISSTTTGKQNYQAGEGKIVLTLWQWAYFNCRSVCKSIIKNSSQGMAINQRWHFLQKLSSWVDTRAEFLYVATMLRVYCRYWITSNLISLYLFSTKLTVWSLILHCNLFKLLSFWGLIILSI